MAVIASATGAAVFGLSGVAAGLAGGALLGAGAGALYNGFTGGDILNGALTGALLGGAVGGLGAGFAGMSAAGGTGLTTTAPLTGTGAIGPGMASTVSSTTPALSVAKGTMGATAFSPSAAAAQQAALGLGAASTAPVTAYGTLAGAAAPTGLATTQALSGLGAGSKVAAGLTGKQMLGYGLAGTGALSLLGGQQRGPGAGQMPDPGMIRPYNYSSAPNEPTGTYPSPYATAEYNEAGNPILDTRERNYFSQGFSPMEPYSAKTGTVNPNIPVTMAARGGLMFDDESGMDEARGLMQGNLQKGLFGQGYAGGGEVDLDQERNKLIMKNIKSASTKDLEKIMGAMNQQEFLMKNMPNYAQAMSPTISGMVEGAQYGDRMAKAYGGQPRDINVMPTMVDPQSGMYGGIASIGRQVDPQTRVNAMANIQRTPYDRNAMESVRRLGVGVDRQLGKDTNLSAFYEQDPMGRNKMGGARLTQRFEEGGEVKHMFGGGLSAMISKMFENNPEMLTKYEYDKTNQRYSTVPQPQQSQGIFAQMFGGAMGARDTGLPSYRFDPAAQEYQALAAGGHLGGYSDGGRMLKGPGDGMSDDIPGVIGNKQPARLADGEFVVPADVVSHLGNGSTDAGAKRLYAMMDEVRKARTGNKKQGKKIKAEKYLPA